MTGLLPLLTDAVVILLLIGGIALFRTPAGARKGNLLALAALVLAVVVVLIRTDLSAPLIVAGALLCGGVLGMIVALRVGMTQIPAMVAFQHGAGALAALLVSAMELSRAAAVGLALPQVAAGIVGMLVGAATFSASLVAAGKLASVLKPQPTNLPAHTWLLAGLLVVSAVAASLLVAAGSAGPGLLLLASVPAVAAGLVLAIRVGGADMPVLISFLNSSAGFAAAFCGIILDSRLLVVCGAAVAASGGVLTLVMCRAMNRRLVNVLGGHRKSRSPSVASLPAEVPATAWAPFETPATAPPKAAVTVEAAGATGPAAAAPAVEAGTSAVATEAIGAKAGVSGEGAPGQIQDAPTDGALERALGSCRDAKTVVIIPGYGMAAAQAQGEVAALARKLQEMGKEVRFAIHPVAGRMPGHMHVLLAEVDVPYDLLIDIDNINPRFADTDLAIVVGACDVVNPAAMTVQDCPISGMPILLAGDARQLVVCNFDGKPGYSGVDNPLYRNPGTTMLLGDAKLTVGQLTSGLTGTNV